MTEEEIKALQNQAAEAETLKARVSELEKDIATKDVLIAQKTDDIVGMRRKYKSIAEMTEEEKESLSAKELELQQRIEEFEIKQKELASKQAEILKTEVESRRANAIKKLVGENPEIAKKVEENYNRIKDVEKAQTEEQIKVHVLEAFNMLGDERPEPISSAMNGADGIAPGEGAPTGFADTAEGKSLSGLMGLPIDNTK